jgi:peptidyl-prolyl cis-trans isomerase D
MWAIIIEWRHFFPMLDLMRRKQRLKIVLWIVIFSLALGMLLFFVPGVNIGNVVTDTSIATVDGKPISATEFAFAYRARIKNLTDSTGNSIDPETLRALGIPAQILESMIATKVVEIVAERFGIEITPEELRQALATDPNFQVDGKFVGIERYKATLARNNLSVADYENDLYLTELAKKLYKIVTDSLEISDRELRNEFSRTTQKTQIDYVVLEKDSYGKQIKPTESNLRSYFDQHADNYRIKEKRKAQYLLIPTAEILPGIKVSEQEILDEWNKMPHEETVEASHILFRVTDASKEAAVKARAEAVLKRAKAGENFSDLAKEYSEDTGTAGEGGYLGPFQRGQMVSEFENAAFSLKPGQISDLVKTEYGYHIIKVLSHETPTLESSRSGIRASIQSRKAEDLAKRKAEEAAKAAETQKDLTVVAKNLGVKTEIKETDFFKNDDSPFAIGVSMSFRDQVFELKEIGSIGHAVEHPLGFAVPKLLEVQMPKPGSFDDQRGRVRSDYIEAQSTELMKAQAAELAASAGEKKSLAEAAKKMGLKVKTSQEFTATESPGPEFGTNSPIGETAFEMAPGEVSSPQALQNNMVVFQVQSRTPFDEAAFREQKETIRNKMLESLRDPYFQTYILNVMDELDKEGKIRRNSKLLESIAMNY